MTPRRKVHSEIRKARVSPSVIPKPIKNQLLFANVISEEIKEASKNSANEDHQVIRNVISGSIVKKYKLMKTLGKMAMTNQRKLAKVTTKSMKIRQVRKKPLVEKGVQNKVIEFFKSDDNSCMMPGKKMPIKLKRECPKFRKDS